MKDLFITAVTGGTLFPSAPDPSLGSIQVAVLARTTQGDPEEWHLKIPVLDALYLLNVLEAMSRDGRLDHLRRPPTTQAQ
jgi:hypothetical protein